MKCGDTTTFDLNVNRMRTCIGFNEPVLYQSEKKELLPSDMFTIKDGDGNDVKEFKCYSSPNGLTIEVPNPVITLYQVSRTNKYCR